MPLLEAPCVELGRAPPTPNITASPTPSSEPSSASSPEPPNVRATPLFRALAMPPPDPEQPPGQEELERRLPGYRRIVIPRELTLIELLKQGSGVTTDEEVLRIREAKLRVVAERVGLTRLHILAPRLRQLTLDGSAIASLRDLGIGLVHLKILSINRCHLTSLDGVWGLSALRELYAAGNRIRDLQPLAALQKLHTLDLAGNPISDPGRLWTLGVCGALRKLTLNDCPVSNTFEYRTSVASALPMLVYLDDRPLHTDIDYDSEGVFDAASLSSESDVEEELELLKDEEKSSLEPVPSCSTQLDISKPNPQFETAIEEAEKLRKGVFLRRPATTENAGVRPSRPGLPARPKTALERPVIEKNSRLQILSTLMDDEWLSSGSKLTSHGAVCGNLARALRRPSTGLRRQDKGFNQEHVEQTMEEASRSVAAEIPLAPKLEDWIKFKQDTGIDINIDISNRPEGPDPSKILDRLEQIEKETQERFREEHLRGTSSFAESVALPNSTLGCIPSRSDFELWDPEEPSHSGMNMLYERDGPQSLVPRFRFPGNSNSQE